MLTFRCAARAVYEFYARGRGYEELHEQNRLSRNLWEKYIPETSFKFVVNAYNHSISKARQREVIEDFSYMGFLGKIDLVSAEITLGCFEECACSFTITQFPFDMIYFTQTGTSMALHVRSTEVLLTVARFSLAGWCAEATTSKTSPFVIILIIVPA